MPGWPSPRARRRDLEQRDTHVDASVTRFPDVGSTPTTSTKAKLFLPEKAQGPKGHQRPQGQREIAMSLMSLASFMSLPRLSRTPPQYSPHTAAAARRLLGRPGNGLVHDPPDRARATAAFGTAAEAAVHLAGRPHRAFSRNGSDLMVRNDIARTHDHDCAPGSTGHPAFLFMLSRKSVHSG